MPNFCSNDLWGKVGTKVKKERAELGFLKTLTFRRCCRNWTVIREREVKSWKPKLVLFLLHFNVWRWFEIYITSKKNPNFLRTVFSTLPLYEKKSLFYFVLANNSYNNGNLMMKKCVQVIQVQMTFFKVVWWCFSKKWWFSIKKKN